MNSYRESEHAITDNEASTSRRGLVISSFKRLSWCGLISVASRTSVAEKESRAIPPLARYVTPRDITAAIARRQRIANHLREADTPEVGIFWFIQEPAGAPEIVASSVAVPQGTAYGMYIDGPEDHVSFWKTMNRVMNPLLRGHGAKDWPRGRVLFNTAMKHFEVDLNRQLLAPQFREEI
jgi:hypothetical protein